MGGKFSCAFAFSEPMASPNARFTKVLAVEMKSPGSTIQVKMKDKLLFLLGSLAAWGALNPHGQAAATAAAEGSVNESSNLSENARSPLPESSGAGTLWRFGAPSALTNKFNLLLPTNLPPPATDQDALARKPRGRGTNLADSGTQPPRVADELSPPTVSNGTSVVWQFGAPSARTNKFNLLLPTNLPPPVANGK